MLKWNLDAIELENGKNTNAESLPVGDIDDLMSSFAQDESEVKEPFHAEQKEESDPDSMESWLDGFSREQLEHLKSGLENGDPDVYEYLGLREDEEDGKRDLVLVRKK